MFMNNPWEEILLSDYENHMKLDSVMQLQKKKPRRLGTRKTKRNIQGIFPRQLRIIAHFLEKINRKIKKYSIFTNIFTVFA